MLRVAALLTVTRRYAKPFAAGIAAASPSRLVSGVAAICSAGAAANCADKQPSIPLVPDGTVRLLNATDGASVAKSIVASFGPGGADVAVQQLDSTVHAAFSPRCGGGKPSKKDAADAKPAGLDDKVVAPAPAPAPAPATAPATASAPAPGVLKIEPAAKGVKQEPAAPEAPKKEPSAAKDEKKSSWSGPSTCPGIRPAFAELAGPVGFIAAALESTCAALQTSGEMNEKQAVEFCVKNAPSACERSEWAAELARLLHFASPERREARKANEQAARDAAKTDEAAFRAALVSVATECCGLEAGAVTAAASTSGSDATRPGLVRLATKVLRARLAGGPLNGVFTPAARTKWRSRTHLDDAKARPHASRADYRKGLGEAYDDLAAALASFLPADVLPKPSKKAEGFTELTGPKLFAPATRVLNKIAAAAMAAAGPAPAPAPDATHPMDVDNAGADAASPEALRTESGDAPAPTPAPSQGERPIASRDDAAQLKARRRMIASAGAHGDGAVASLVELFGPLGLGAELAEELVRGLDRDDAKAHEKSKPKEAVAAPRTARRFAAGARRPPIARRPSPSHAQLDAFFASAKPARRSSRGDKRPRVVDAPPPPKRRFQREAAVGDRVVWMKYGREGVVEAEDTPGVFIVFFDKGCFRETVRADELRVL
uniref:Uncharacterized protein n=1 Tax=Pelagomonas calceolata TaxID=35677 RepID=A0A7S4E849_9STRA